MAKLVVDDARASPMKGESPSSTSLNADDVSVLKTSPGDANGEKGSTSKTDRGLWGSQLEFVMTCISYAGKSIFFARNIGNISHLVDMM